MACQRPAPIHAHCPPGYSYDPDTGECSSNVAVLPKSPGEHCHDSISALGENVPVNTSDYAHSVKDIYTVAASTTQINGMTATGVMAYIYVDANGNWYIGESPSYTGNALDVLSKDIPVLGSFLNGLSEYGKNFDQQIAPADVAKMKKDGNMGQTISVQPCFSEAA